MQEQISTRSIIHNRETINNTRWLGFSFIRHAKLIKCRIATEIEFHSQTRYLLIIFFK